MSNSHLLNLNLVALSGVILSGLIFCSKTLCYSFCDSFVFSLYTLFDDWSFSPDSLFLLFVYIGTQIIF